jgi:hypothetical protein
MDNYLKINDLVAFDFLNPNLTSIKDDFDAARGPFEKIKDADIKKLDSKGLKVRIAATHAGVLTRNNMFYLPDKMKKGTPTFLEDYGKPVLKHHNEKQDNIGRVIDAVYVDTSGTIRDVVKDSSFSDSSFRDFCDGKMPFSYQVDFVRKYLNKSIQDSKSLIESGAYIGLGHIQIIVDIVDPDAIQKFLDGRYLTGSVGARTNKAVCSICKQNWTESGPCEHEPGTVYDEKKCVLITGDFFYDEYSMVNSPADRQSRVLELYYNGNIKNIEVKNEVAGSIYEVKLGFPQYVKEEGMGDKRAEETKEIKDSVEEKVDKTKGEEVKDSKVKDTDQPKDEEKVKDDVSPEFSIDNALASAFEKEELTEEESDKLYDSMMEEFSDAKLSTEKRKKLAKSTFCGPDKSFPVPDCAHVTAARRLIGKYKGSGDKSKILACVDRKAKAMGCDKKVKDATCHARVLHMLTEALTEHMYEKKYREKEGKDPVLTEEDVNTLTVVMKNLAGMVGKDNFVLALSSGEQELKDIVKHFQDIDLLDEIISLEESMGELRDELSEVEDERDALKEEYDLLQKDVDAVRDELVETKKQFRDSKVDKMSILTSLKGDKISDEQKDEWTSLTDEAFDTSLNNLEKEVDIQQMADKLNNGTSRNPQGGVEDPTLGFDDMRENIQNKIRDIRAKAWNAFDNVVDGEAWASQQIKLLLEREKDQLWKDR